MSATFVVLAAGGLPKAGVTASAESPRASYSVAFTHSHRENLLMTDQWKDAQKARDDGLSQSIRAVQTGQPAPQSVPVVMQPSLATEPPAVREQGR